MRALAAAEWTGSAFRIFNLATTDHRFDRTTRIHVLFAAMVAINTATLILSLRRRGPFTWGRAGVVFEIAESAGTMLLLAILLPARSYQSGLPGQLPLANYLCPLAVLLAIYRRAAAGTGRAWRAVLSDLFLMGLLVPYFALLAVVNGYRPDQIRWDNLASQAAPTVLAVFIGYGLWRVVRDFADAEVQAADAQHEAFSAWLHSELLGTLAALRLLTNPTTTATARTRTAAITAGLEDLDQAVRSAQHHLTLDQDSVAVADLIAHQVRRFRTVVHVDSPGMVGGWRLDGPAARHLDRLLGDVFTNATQAGATRINLTVDRHRHHYLIQVTDNGPGIPDDALDHPETSLGRLAAATAALGGTLTGRRNNQGGTRITATIPTPKSRPR